MDEDLFWIKSTLGKIADHCVWHCVIPMLFTQQIVEWEKLKDIIDISKDKPSIFIVKRLTLRCALCKDDVTGKHVRMAIRCLIAKAKSKVNSNRYLYHIVIIGANICNICNNKKIPDPELDSGLKNMSMILNHLNKIAKKVEEDNSNLDLTGKELWDIISHTFHENHTEIMKKIAKIYHTCSNCLNENATKFCSGCNYKMYCDEKCSHKDWELHKKECKFLKNCSLLLNTKFMKKY
jgi:hypothetical protein